MNYTKMAGQFVCKMAMVLTEIDSVTLEPLGDSSFIVSFTTAKAQAETEMANLFGLGAGSSTATAWRKAFNEVISYNLLQRIKMAIVENETIVPDDIKISLVRGVESSYIFTILQVSPRAFESLGNSAAAYYQECLQKRAYFASLLASVFGLGGCSSENEGAFADFSSDMYELKCESNAWSMVFRKTDKVHVDHTFGTMTDTRDGKTYKTVQLNLDDVSQTWMAENLNYETEGSSCFLEEFFTGEMSYCSSYGRIYSFVARLDSSYRKYTTKEGCVDVKTLEYLNESSSDDTLYWRGRAEEDWYRIGIRSVPYLFAPKVLSEGDRDSTYDFSNRVVYGSIVYAVNATMYNVNRYHELKQAYGRPEMGFVRCIKDE